MYEKILISIHKKIKKEGYIRKMKKYKERIYKNIYKHLLATTHDLLSTIY